MIPQELQSLLHWIITGQKHAPNLNCGKKEEIEKSIGIIGQVIINLSNFHLSISYDKLLKIETLLSNAVVKKMEDCNVIYLPLGIQHGN